MKSTREMIPEVAWESYWSRLYNRLERGLSWILVSVGAIIVLSYSAYHALQEFIADSSMPLVVKWGVAALVLGGIMLLVSVLREKLLLRKHDRYKEVER